MLERECSKRILMRNIVSAYAFAFLIGTSACSPSPEPSTRTNPNANLHAEFHSIIDEYVLRTHGWAKDAYRLEFDRNEGEILAFEVINLEEEKQLQANPRPGGGESFEVLVDRSTRRVTREMHFQ
jgi:hypothetical protein